MIELLISNGNIVYYIEDIKAYGKNVKRACSGDAETEGIIDYVDIPL